MRKGMVGRKGKEKLDISATEGKLQTTQSQRAQFA
jgi:hypothetical protein